MGVPSSAGSARLEGGGATSAASHISLPSCLQPRTAFSLPVVEAFAARRSWSSSGRAHAFASRRAASVFFLVSIGTSPASAIKASAGVERVHPVMTLIWSVWSRVWSTLCSPGRWLGGTAWKYGFPGGADGNWRSFWSVGEVTYRPPRPGRYPTAFSGAGTAYARELHWPGLARWAADEIAHVL